MSGRVGGLLARGMVAGLAAGLLAAACAMVLGEPSIEQAIAIEAAAEQAANHAEAPEIVSRAVQSREGLLTAGALYGAAIGGLFGLGFALAHGRLGRLGPTATTAVLAAAGFLAIALVPALKYPASPPAVGDPGTIGLRTGLYFGFLLVSVGAMALAAAASGPLRLRFGTAVGTLASLALFIALVATAGMILPAAEAAPADFPSDLIESFRWATLATQAVLWAALGFGFSLVLPRRSI
jgi:predicted cobalt transporter CbtA